jgi:DNA-binding transcriptional LysR family regulator
MYHHDLQSLRLFTAICELRSLSKGAARVNLALSAASRRLKLLEEEFGAPLLKRLPHGVELTAAGVTAERYAQAVLRMADQLSANMADHRAGVRGRIRVCASSSALLQKLAADLAQFAREHPEIRIDLEERPTAETLEALSRKQADIGVIVRGIPPHRFAHYPYAQDRLAVAVHEAHPLAGRSRVAFDEILDEDLISLDTSTAVYRLTAGKAREAGRVLKIRVQVHTFDVMCQMVRHRLGIGILPEAALRPLADALGLQLIALDEPWALRDIDLVVPSLIGLDGPTERLLGFLRAA